MEKLKNYDYCGVTFDYSEEFLNSINELYSINDIEFLTFNEDVTHVLGTRLVKIGFEIGDFKIKLSDINSDIVLSLKSTFTDIPIKSVVSSIFVSKYREAAISILVGVVDILSQYFAKGVIKANPMLNFNKFEFALQFIPFDKKEFSYSIGNSGDIGKIIKVNNELVFLLEDEKQLNYKKSDIVFAGQIIKHLQIANNYNITKLRLSDYVKIKFSKNIDSRTVYVEDNRNINVTAQLDTIHSLFWRRFKSFEYKGNNVTFKWNNKEIVEFVVKDIFNEINFNMNDDTQICDGDSEFIKNVILFMKDVGSFHFNKFLLLPDENLFIGRQLNTLEILSIIINNPYKKYSFDISNLEQISHYIPEYDEIIPDENYIIACNSLKYIVQDDDFDSMYEKLLRILNYRQKMINENVKQNFSEFLSEVVKTSSNINFKNLFDSKLRDDNVSNILIEFSNKGHSDIKFMVTTRNKLAYLLKSPQGFIYVTRISHSNEYREYVEKRSKELSELYCCKFITEFKNI